jgi:hypothetical protein
MHLRTLFVVTGNDLEVKKRKVRDSNIDHKNKQGNSVVFQQQNVCFSSTQKRSSAKIAQEK